MLNLVEIGQNAAEIWRSFDVSRWRPPLSWNFKILIFQRSTASSSRGSNCVAVPNLVEIGQNAAEIWRFFDFSRWRPSAILDLIYMCVRTTHEGHLVVFIAVQNLAGIDAVVLIMCMFFDFTPIHAHKMGFFGGD